MLVSRGWKRSSWGAVRFATLCAILLAVPLSLFSYRIGFADGWLPDTSVVDPTTGQTLDSTKAPNVIENNKASQDGLRIGGIANTRHNLTMSYLTNERSAIMDRFRNNYYEVCVYCHTPHGANSTAAAPLWNRTVAKRNYVLYNQDQSTSSTTYYQGTGSGLKYTQPGPNSLTCLSCHDGATAIDSIINMPTQLTATNMRAGYSAAQESTVNNDFLDAWSGNLLGMPSPGDPNSTGDVTSHAGFNTQESGSLCITCHNPNSLPPFDAPDFEVLSIGDQFNAGVTNNARANYLADDHPIGVTYPTSFGSDVDYREPDVSAAKIAFFDDNSNGRIDPNEVRLYDTGDGYEVECGSCHDPHGIKVAGDDNNELIPSFLRVGDFDNRVSRAAGLGSDRSQVSANQGSKLCLTCHVK